MRATSTIGPEKDLPQTNSGIRQHIWPPQQDDNAGREAGMTDTDNLTDEELTERANPVIEEEDEDASPGDLSGERTDEDGGIDDDSGFLEDVEAHDDELAASTADHPR